MRLAASWACIRLAFAFAHSPAVARDGDEALMHRSCVTHGMDGLNAAWRLLPALSSTAGSPKCGAAGRRESALTATARGAAGGTESSSIILNGLN
eukprot:scaffold13462_cov87-Isochrysis_galbana.AAC.4